jgi:hypothetical protein
MTDDQTPDYAVLVSASCYHDTQLILPHLGNLPTPYFMLRALTTEDDTWPATAQAPKPFLQRNMRERPPSQKAVSDHMAHACCWWRTNAE